MSTHDDDDLERRLSRALHELAPEPPTGYRFTPPGGAGGTDDVLDLGSRRRHRWLPPLLAAAAAVVIAGGVVAVTSLAQHRDEQAVSGPTSVPGTAAPVQPAPSSTSPGSAASGCLSRLNSAVDPGEPKDGVMRVTVTLTNPTALDCRLSSPPTVAFHRSQNRTGPPYFPGGRHMLQTVVPAKGRWVFTATLRSTGACARPTSHDTGYVEIDLPGNGYVIGIGPLCRPKPVRARLRIVGASGPPVCGRDALVIAQGRLTHGGGTIGTTVTMRNTSAHACTVSTAPDFSVADGAAATAAVSFRQHPSPGTAVSPPLTAAWCGGRGSPRRAVATPRPPARPARAGSCGSGATTASPTPSRSRPRTAS